MRGLSPRLMGRGQVLGTFQGVAEFSAAFGADGEARLALPSAAPFVISALVEAIYQRVDADSWVWAYGEGPDALATLTRACERFPGLPAAFDGAGEEEAIALLALLAGDSSPRGPRVLPARARLLLAGGASEPSGCSLAWCAGPDGVASRVEAFRARAGDEVPFWIADRNLGVRFSVGRCGVSFKAHHPVIQEELLRRCEREGIDVA